MNDYLISMAFENFRRMTGIEMLVANTSDNSLYNFTVTINNMTFAAILKNTADKITATKIIDSARVIKKDFNLPTLLISGCIGENVFDLLMKNGVGAIETSGNCRIVKPPLYVIISGQKRIALPKDETHAYTPARLKIILYLLLGKGNINQTFRNIAEGAGVSLGIVKYTIDDLVNKRYVIKTSEGRVLKEEKSLLKMWAPYYDQILKPKLFIGSYDFVRSDDKAHWQSITLPNGMSWGGEVAANLIDNYLFPEKYEIYTSLRPMQILATGLLKPVKDGPVNVYNAFWGDVASKTAPLPVVYADLLGINDSRCLDAAERLIRHYKIG